MERLDRFLAEQLQNISRKGAKELVRRGEVTVNGVKAASAEQKIDPAGDVIAVSGRAVKYRRFLYIMLNKPAGVVCATRDGLSQTVLELLPEELRRRGLFPAGRLDRDTVGFVLITDDGELAHRVLSPKSHVPKKYFVRLRDPVTSDIPEKFSAGIIIDGPETCLPAEIEILSGRECLLTLHEGKYHQVKRMFAALGNEVVYLKRTEIAGIPLDAALDEGKARELTENEVERLKSGL